MQFILHIDCNEHNIGDVYLGVRRVLRVRRRRVDRRDGRRSQGGTIRARNRTQTWLRQSQRSTGNRVAGRPAIRGSCSTGTRAFSAHHRKTALGPWTSAVSAAALCSSCSGTTPAETTENVNIMLIMWYRSSMIVFASYDLGNIGIQLQRPRVLYNNMFVHEI